MASTIDWPISLPQLSDVTEQVPDTRLVSQTDIGPAKMRRRYTYAPRVVSGKLYLNAQQRIEFDTFYRTTLVAGTLSFNWEDPVTDAEIEMRFRAVGTFSLLAGGHPTARVWTVDVSLEVLSAS